MEESRLPKSVRLRKSMLLSCGHAHQSLPLYLYGLMNCWGKKSETILLYLQPTIHPKSRLTQASHLSRQSKYDSSKFPISMRNDITKFNQSFPVDFRMLFTKLGRDMVRRFANDMQLSFHGIAQHLVLFKLMELNAAHKTVNFAGGFANIPQISFGLFIRQHKPPVRCVKSHACDMDCVIPLFPPDQRGD